MKSYDCKPGNYITYLDMNNLYGWKMSQYLPYGELTWLTFEQINRFNVSLIPNDSSDGYMLEADLEYPEE